MIRLLLLMTVILSTQNFALSKDSKKLRFFESDYSITNAIVNVFESRELTRFNFDELKKYKFRFANNLFYKKYELALKSYSLVYNENSQSKLNSLCPKKVRILRKAQFQIRRKIQQLCFSKLFNKKMSTKKFSKIIKTYPLAIHSYRSQIRYYIKRNKLTKEKAPQEISYFFPKERQEENLIKESIANILKLRKIAHAEKPEPKEYRDLLAQAHLMLANKGLLKNKSIQKNLYFLTRTLFRHKHVKDSQVLIRKLISQSDTYTEELKFDLLWSYISFNKYKEAYEKVLKSYNIPNNYQLLENPQLLYWTAYTLEQLEKKHDHIYSFLYKKFPLSYYSIIASIRDSSSKKLFSENSNYKELKLSIKQKQHLALIKAFSVNNSNTFLNKEIRAFTDEKENTKPEVLFLLAKELQADKNYLESFKLVYSSLTKELLLPNKDLLNLLYPRPYLGIISKHDSNIDPYLALSLIRQESSFDHKAESSAGARGLMQLMPATAKNMSKNVSIRDLEKPKVNIKLGMKYLKELSESYNKNFVYTLSSYNAGERNLKKWKEQYFFSDSLIKNIENIPFNETQKYVKLIFRNIYYYHLLDQLNGKKESFDGKILISKYLETKH